MGEIYKAYLDNYNTHIDDEYTRTVFFEHRGIKYRVIITHKRANRLSLIRCQNRNIIWEQIPFLYLRFYDRGRGEELFRLPVITDKEYTTIIVIKGKPRSIWGLDEGIFRSAHKIDRLYINVMSEARFKEL
ncbi:MAG: hypothetical protein IJD67_00550 [Clostridia bacterium]|nr:hypothetical protein [Clostridia bacterium]